MGHFLDASEQEGQVLLRVYHVILDFGESGREFGEIADHEVGFAPGLHSDQEEVESDRGDQVIFHFSQKGLELE